MNEDAINDDILCCSGILFFGGLIIGAQFFDGMGILIPIFILVSIIYFGVQKDKKASVKKWILDIVPELESGNLEISRGLIRAVLPIYQEYQKFNKKIDKIKPRKEEICSKINSQKQKIHEYEQIILTIKKIGEAEKLNVNLSPKINSIREKIKEEKENIYFLKNALSPLLDLKKEHAKKQSIAKAEAKTIIAKWIIGIEKKLKKNIKQKIDKEVRDRDEILKLILETKTIIENAIRNVKDPARMSALKILLIEASDLSDEFEAERISYQEIKSRILEKKEEAEILSKQTNEEISQKSYYDILEIDFDATQKEIKKAYYKKMQEYHPDKFTNQPEWIRIEADKMSKKINEAYSVLCDAKKRKKYDKENKTS